MTEVTSSQQIGSEPRAQSSGGDAIGIDRYLTASIHHRFYDYLGEIINPRLIPDNLRTNETITIEKRREILEAMAENLASAGYRFPELASIPDLHTNGIKAPRAHEIPSTVSGLLAARTAYINNEGRPITVFDEIAASSVGVRTRPSDQEQNEFLYNAIRNLNRDKSKLIDGRERYYLLMITELARAGRHCEREHKNLIAQYQAFYRESPEEFITKILPQEGNSQESDLIASALNGKVLSPAQKGVLLAKMANVLGTARVQELPDDLNSWISAYKREKVSTNSYEQVPSEEERFVEELINWKDGLFMSLRHRREGRKGYAWTFQAGSLYSKDTINNLLYGPLRNKIYGEQGFERELRGSSTLIDHGIYQVAAIVPFGFRSSDIKRGGSSDTTGLLLIERRSPFDLDLQGRAAPENVSILFFDFTRIHELEQRILANPKILQIIVEKGSLHEQMDQDFRKDWEKEKPHWEADRPYVTDEKLQEYWKAGGTKNKLLLLIKPDKEAGPGQKDNDLEMERFTLPLFSRDRIPFPHRYIDNDEPYVIRALQEHVIEYE